MRDDSEFDQLMRLADQDLLRAYTAATDYGEQDLANMVRAEMARRGLRGPPLPRGH